MPTNPEYGMLDSIACWMKNGSNPPPLTSSHGSYGFRYENKHTLMEGIAFPIFSRTEEDVV